MCVFVCVVLCLRCIYTVLPAYMLMHAHTHTHMCARAHGHTRARAHTHTHCVLAQDIIGVLDACWLAHAGAAEEGASGGAVAEAAFVVQVGVCGCCVRLSFLFCSALLHAMNLSKHKTFGPCGCDRVCARGRAYHVALRCAWS